MKLTVLYTMLLAFSSHAFAPSPAVKQSSTQLGWFFDKPFHGHGSGEDKNELDDQWEAQQAILRERRASGIDKEHLKDKYKGSNENASPDLHAKETPHFMWEETWTEEVKPEMKKKAVQKKKFFWEK